jgi:hypothetical protein
MTTTPLRDRARQQRPDSQPDHQPAAAPDEFPPVEYNDPVPDDPTPLPPHLAWLRVMRDVRNITKQSDLPLPGGKTVKFRGINEVVSALSNALRRHGVVIIPADVDAHYRDVKSVKGTQMRECTVKVTYWIYGPDGNHLVACGQGEAAAVGDNATTKACRVAYRNMALDALCAATGAPDPESEGFERGEQTISPAGYATEIMDERTTLARLRQIRGELRDAGRLTASVETPQGDMALGALIDHVGLARKEGRDPFPAADTDDVTGGADPDSDPVVDDPAGAP